MQAMHQIWRQCLHQEWCCSDKAGFHGCRGDWEVISGGALLPQWLAIICEATHPRFRRTHLRMRLRSAVWWTVANHCCHYLNMKCCDIAPRARRFPLPYGPGQVKLPVGQVDLNRFFLFISYKQIKEFQNTWSRASDEFKASPAPSYRT